MSRLPRVLLLTPTPPFPPDNGGMLRVLSLARGMAGRAELELLTFVRATGERRHQQNAAAMALSRVFTAVHEVPKETTALPPSACPDLPASVREWWSPEMAAAVSRLTRSGRFDVLHAEFLLMSAYAPYARGVRTVLTEHDASHLSPSRSYFREWAGPRRAATAAECRRLRRHHKAACESHDRVVTLTPEDDARVRRSAPGARTVLVPTGVDLARFAHTPEDKTQDFDLAFVGHYPHFPNEDAALFLAREVMPLVRRARPAARLALVGSAPTPAVRALASDLTVVTGTVPDVRPWLDRAKVFVAPVRLGFGVKGKVLEAFARGRATVCTRSVARGLPGAEHGRHLLAADTARGLADCIVALLASDAKRSALTRAARTLVESRWGWEPSYDKLAALYAQLATARARALEPA